VSGNFFKKVLLFAFYAVIAFIFIAFFMYALNGFTCQAEREECAQATGYCRVSSLCLEITFPWQ